MMIMTRHPNWSATKAIHLCSSHLLQWGFNSHTYEHRQDDVVDENDNDDDVILIHGGKCKDLHMSHILDQSQRQ